MVDCGLWMVVGGPDVQHTALLRHLLLAQLATPCVLHGLRSPMVAHHDRVPLVNSLWRYKAFYFGVWNT